MAIMTMTLGYGTYGWSVPQDSDLLSVKEIHRSSYSTLLKYELKKPIQFDRLYAGILHVVLGDGFTSDMFPPGVEIEDGVLRIEEVTRHPSRLPDEARDANQYLWYGKEVSFRLAFSNAVDHLTMPVVIDEQYSQTVSFQQGISAGLLVDDCYMPLNELIGLCNTEDLAKHNLFKLMHYGVWAREKNRLAGGIKADAVYTSARRTEAFKAALLFDDKPTSPVKPVAKSGRLISYQTTSDFREVTIDLPSPAPGWVMFALDDELEHVSIPDEGCTRDSLWNHPTPMLYAFGTKSGSWKFILQYPVTVYLGGGGWRYIYSKVKENNRSVTAYAMVPFSIEPSTIQGKPKVWFGLGRKISNQVNAAKGLSFALTHVLATLKGYKTKEKLPRVATSKGFHAQLVGNAFLRAEQSGGRNIDGSQDALKGVPWYVYGVGNFLKGTFADVKDALVPVLKSDDGWQKIDPELPKVRRLLDL